MKVETRPFTARVKPGALGMVLKFKRYSYRELAARTGVSKSTIGNLSSGAATYCNPETAAALARGLGVDTEDLFALEALPDPEARIA